MSSIAVAKAHTNIVREAAASQPHSSRLAGSDAATDDSPDGRHARGGTPPDHTNILWRSPIGRADIDIPRTRRGAQVDEPRRQAVYRPA